MARLLSSFLALYLLMQLALLPHVLEERARAARRPTPRPAAADSLSAAHDSLAARSTVTAGATGEPRGR